MKEVCWPYFDPDFETLVERINGPSCRVCIDNDCCRKCTVIKVNSVNKQGLLLEVVQVLTDMDLVIYKSYISSDAGFFMDVFHVRDQEGNKITDQTLIDHIKQALGVKRELQKSQEVQETCTGKSIGDKILNGCIAIEMTGVDRPGLFSEISAVLTELKCNVVEAHAWSHNARIACIVHISEESKSGCIDDPGRLATIEDQLSTVLRADATHDDASRVTTGLHGWDGAVTHTERRLHQLMLAERDFDGPKVPFTTMSPLSLDNDEGRKPVVWIDRFNEKGYSVVHLESKDRPKLMFDVVCTLTDMNFVVFHASAVSHGSTASQEYYIRHMNGCPLNSETEKEYVIKCLQAALERRVCEGVRLELCAHNRVGLLSDITRLLREYGLAVVRADVVTHGEESLNVFYVRDISGNAVDMEIIDSMRKEIAPLTLQVKNESVKTNSTERSHSHFSLGHMLRSKMERFSHNFVPTR